MRFVLALALIASTLPLAIAEPTCNGPVCYQESTAVTGAGSCDDPAPLYQKLDRLDVWVDTGLGVRPRVVVVNGCFATEQNGNTYWGRWLHVYTTNGDGAILGDGRLGLVWNEYSYGPTGGAQTYSCYVGIGSTNYEIVEGVDAPNFGVPLPCPGPAPTLLPLGLPVP